MAKDRNYPTTQEIASKTKPDAPAGADGKPGAVTPDAAAPIMEALQTLGAFVASLKNAGNPKADEAMNAFRALIQAIRPAAGQPQPGNPIPTPPPSAQVQGAPMPRPMGGAPAGAPPMAGARPMGMPGAGARPM